MTAEQVEPTSRHHWIAYAAACWALIFGAFHIIWAAGWYPGLDPLQAQAAFAVPWKLAYDLVAAAMCIIAVPVALALAMPWGRRVPRRLLVPLAWTGTGLLFLRAVASIIQTAYFLVTGQFSVRDMGVWEPWFYVGATLFTINLWQYWRREKAGAA
ncbi:MAG: DUF3995 domain-containing protein [Gemmatimonadaceae bacterium]